MSVIRRKTRSSRFSALRPSPKPVGTAHTILFNSFRRAGKNLVMKTLPDFASEFRYSPSWRTRSSRFSALRPSPKHVGTAKEDGDHRENFLAWERRKT